ncbi:hypothetical protein [uncultured Psychroserpens sp.]|uniref:hypothetical protein n=1 Tax=uncultured Psychroserpens sp. TaxID=255436 RepID=UPI00262D84B4|nr:hypothetical protein [uncultured Psychroserpens sp.]
MSKLQIQYSKELAKALGKIAVYLPGEHVEVGDIITFPFGKSIFGKTKPIGSFKKITSLDKIGVHYEKPKFSNNPDTYHFTSKKSISFDVNLDTNMALGGNGLPESDNLIDVQFSSEGAIYFLGIDCDKKELSDLISLENEINVKGKQMLWEDTYLVTSVTIAKKALIMQSRTKSSSLVLEGNVKGVKSGAVDASGGAKFSIKRQRGDVFIKNWSDDVTVFMDVMKFEKEVFSSESYRSTEDLETFKIKMNKVSANELLTD